MALLVTLAPGTPVRTESECAQCGWDDVWQAAVHSLSAHGVGTLATVRTCIRCGARNYGGGPSPD